MHNNDVLHSTLYSFRASLPGASAVPSSWRGLHSRAGDHSYPWVGPADPRGAGEARSGKCMFFFAINFWAGPSTRTIAGGNFSLNCLLPYSPLFIVAPFLFEHCFSFYFASQYTDVTSILICGGKKDVRSQEASLRQRPDVVVSSFPDSILFSFPCWSRPRSTLSSLSNIKTYYCSLHIQKFSDLYAWSYAGPSAQLTLREFGWPGCVGAGRGRQTARLRIPGKFSLQF